MNELRVKNFRCFREEQTARLAPLTLLVGEKQHGEDIALSHDSCPLGNRLPRPQPRLQGATLRFRQL